MLHCKTTQEDKTGRHPEADLEKHQRPHQAFHGQFIPGMTLARLWVILKSHKNEKI